MKKLSCIIMYPLILIVALSFFSYASGETGRISMLNESDHEDTVNDLIQSMTIDEKICQLFLVTPEAISKGKRITVADRKMERSLRKFPVGGLVFFSRNIKNREQVASMIKQIQTYAGQNHGLRLFIGVDEEGGTVSRITDKLEFGKVEPMRTIGDRGNEKEAYETGMFLALSISSLGFNLDFAPVADVITNDQNTEIGSRSFGTDARLVSEMIEQITKGLMDGGVMPTLKHFPGHGSTAADSHTGKTISARTKKEFEQTEWPPFRAGMAAGARFVMMSHLTAEELDNENPASLSPYIVTGILRKELGFDGIIITDALQMKSISEYYGSGEAVVKALEAGVDMLLMPYNFTNALNGIKKAIKDGRITEERINESVRRILKIKMDCGLISTEE